MFKYSISLFLLMFALALSNESFAITEPTEAKNKTLETDSTTVADKDSQLLNTPTKAKDTKIAFWESDEEVEEDSDSALSFNFIYYIIEKFKFQVE